MGSDLQDSDSSIQMGESIAMSADGSRALLELGFQEQDLQELTSGMVHLGINLVKIFLELIMLIFLVNMFQ